MITILLLSVLCLTADHPAPLTVETYSVRADGAGNACDCRLAPCGQRALGCIEENGSACPLLVEPGCFLGSPDECGNVGACAYLDIHAFPGAISWRAVEENDTGCFETDFQEVAVGWTEWWRIR